MQVSSKLNGAFKSGLAGAAALAAGSAAYGGITVIATPADLGPVAEGTIAPAAGSIPWDVDGNTVSDLGFSYRNPTDAPTGNQTFWQGNIRPFLGAPAGTSIMGYRGPFIQYGQNLPLGTTIGPAVPTIATGDLAQPGIGFRSEAQVVLGSIYRSAGVATPYGGFAAGASVPVGVAAETGYVGFRVGSGATARYGWLQLRLIPGTTAGGGGIDFIAAAIGDPGEAIGAGDIPEPTSLAALVVGAAALLRRRA